MIKSISLKCLVQYSCWLKTHLIQFVSLLILSIYFSFSCNSAVVNESFKRVQTKNLLKCIAFIFYLFKCTKPAFFYTAENTKSAQKKKRSANFVNESSFSSSQHSLIFVFERARRKCKRLRSNFSESVG